MEVLVQEVADFMSPSLRNWHFAGCYRWLVQGLKGPERFGFVMRRRLADPTLLIEREARGPEHASKQLVRLAAFSIPPSIMLQE